MMLWREMARRSRLPRPYGEMSAAEIRGKVIDNFHGMY